MIGIISYEETIKILATAESKLSEFDTFTEVLLKKCDSTMQQSISVERVQWSNTYRAPMTSQQYKKQAIKIHSSLTSATTFHSVDVGTVHKNKQKTAKTPAIQVGSFC
ncbi:hypothetical protein K7432_017685 [Basidiobolus ranarum]|uniref:Uncharacterized protein n=1 Tax=Basidiobolus ranarum TaxID=34480 RepID=A0ABR2VK35_9FUNG